MPIWAILSGVGLAFHPFLSPSPLTVKISITQSPPYHAQKDDFLLEISRLLSAGRQSHQDFDDAAAADYYKQALSLIEAQETANAASAVANNATDLFQKGEALHGLGRAYFYLQDYGAAQPLLEAALTIYETHDEPNESSNEHPCEAIQIDLYGLLSVIAEEMGSYATALGYSKSALARSQANDCTEEVTIFHHDIGAIEADIGQYESAELSLLKAVELSEQADLPDIGASAIFALGWTQERQENFEAAIAYYQDAILLFSELRQTESPQQPLPADHLSDHLFTVQPSEEQLSEEQLSKEQDILSREVRAHNNLGIVYLKQDNLAAARQSFNRGLALLNQQENGLERSLLIDSLGSLHKAEGNINQAWLNYLQAWQLAQQNSDAANEIAILLNLGELFNRQGEPELAIFFYKQAIVQLETIRTDLRQLSQSVQQRYTRSVESAYRTLADLLLQQGRETEALQVLELLKLQEVKTYLHNEREGRTAGAQTFNNPAEAALLLILETLPPQTSLAEFVAHPAVIALKTPFDSSQNLEDTFSLQAVDALKRAIAQKPDTAALYPLILEDRLEVLLVTSPGIVERFTVQASRADIHATVSELQSTLQNKAVDSTLAAQRLYQWFIEPLTETLTAQQIENIIYLPDGVLRYVPLAAFHDGDRWLVETYRSHTITAATIDDLTTQNEAPLGVMAGAFTDSNVVHQVEVGERSFAYAGLKAAQQEVDNLRQALPNSTALINQAFNPDRLLAGIGDRPILHLATHAQFIPGEPEDSFILFGDGRTVNLRELRQWQLPNVELVVLSACQTASSTEGDGKEILGLGYQIRSTGAKAAIASLWAVDDVATAALMSQFYQHLSEGHTKAQALHQAQIDLIESQIFSNPYDWAAFILIGNGL